jgi:VanZ family protein
MTETTRRKTFPRVILVSTLIMLTILFFFGGPDYYSARSFKNFWNLGHILYYALLTFAICSFPREKAIRPVAQFIICMVVTFILGLLVEFVQSNFQRTPDAGDLFRNMIGACVGMFFLAPLKKTLPRRRLRFIQAVTLFLAGMQIYPITVDLTDEYRANRQFPVLSGFETPYEIYRWRGDTRFFTDDTVAATGGHAMRIDLNTDQYSGVSLHYFHEDWTGYQWFQALVYNPSPENLTIVCRIHDRLHAQSEQRYEDRFNQPFNLTRGWNTIRIDLDHVKNAPRNRRMDMRHIYGIGFFAVRLEHPRTIFIDDVLLK